MGEVEVLNLGKTTEGFGGWRTGSSWCINTLRVCLVGTGLSPQLYGDLVDSNGGVEVCTVKI